MYKILNKHLRSCFATEDDIWTVQLSLFILQLFECVKGSIGRAHAIQ